MGKHLRIRYKLEPILKPGHGLKPVDIHGEACDIYEIGQMSNRSVCSLSFKFKAGKQDLKDAAHSGRLPTTTTKSNIKKITDLLNQDAGYTIRNLARFDFFSMSSWHFKKTPES